MHFLFAAFFVEKNSRRKVWNEIMAKKDEDKRVVISISLDCATRDRLKKIAKAHHLTVSGLVSMLTWATEIPKRDDEEDEDDE